MTCALNGETVSVCEAYTARWGPALKSTSTATNRAKTAALRRRRHFSATAAMRGGHFAAIEAMLALQRSEVCAALQAHIQPALNDLPMRLDAGNGESGAFDPGRARRRSRNEGRCQPCVG